MTWPVAIADILTVLGVAFVCVWRLSAWTHRLRDLEAQVCRLRNWRHERAAPVLQLVLADYEFRTGTHVVRGEWDEDSRIVRQEKPR